MTEHDVVVFAADASAGPIAAQIRTDLSRRGFRVGSLDASESAPDFVAVWSATPDVANLEPVVQAVTDQRNVVVVLPKGTSLPPLADLPAGLQPLARQQAVPFDAARVRESLELVSHRLSSDSLVTERRLMRRMKRLFIAAGLFCLTGVALQTVPMIIREWKRPKMPPPVAPFTLYWASFGESRGPSGWQEAPIVDGSQVAAGDRLRLVFSPSADGHAYVVMRSRAGDIRVLYPIDAINGASKVRAGQVYTAPVGDGWLVVEDGPAFPAALFIVASYDALQNLEELIEEPNASAIERRQLLADTIDGLLDGRHAAVTTRVWTGKLQMIDRNLLPRPAPPAVTVALQGGGQASRTLSPQRGWVAAAVEVKLGSRSPGQ